MRTLVVGDIHGCFAELEALLDLAGLREGDRLVCVGDLTGRGPEPAEVLRLFMSRPRTDAVMGNHEWKMVERRPGPVRALVREACGEPLWREALDWMAGLPLRLELDAATVVHWGLEPGVEPARQRPEVLLGLPAGEARLAEVLGGRPWYEAYPGPRPVIYGHHSWAAGVRRDLTYGIDTGCVYGGRLTGLWLPGFDLVSVPARGDHWARLRAAHPELEANGGG